MADFAAWTCFSNMSQICLLCLAAPATNSMISLKIFPISLIKEINFGTGALTASTSIKIIKLLIIKIVVINQYN